MPAYEYQCECGKQRTEVRRLADFSRFADCECGKKAALVITVPPARDWFRPHINENFSTPIEITSKRQYREECAKHGVIARCLE